jgi:hypothetical protein
MDDGMDDETDGWKASFRPRRPLLYVISGQLIYRVNCYLRQGILACHVCLYQLASHHPCTHTSGKQCATSIVAEEGARQRGWWWTMEPLLYLIL